MTTRRRNTPAKKAPVLDKDDTGTQEMVNFSQPEHGEGERPEGETVHVMSTFRNKFHPYQKVEIPEGAAVPIILDDWTQVQIDAGVLIKVG